MQSSPETHPQSPPTNQQEAARLADPEATTQLGGQLTGSSRLVDEEFVDKFVGNEAADRDGVGGRGEVVEEEDEEGGAADAGAAGGGVGGGAAPGQCVICLETPPRNRGS